MEYKLICVEYKMNLTNLSSLNCYCMYTAMIPLISSFITFLRFVVLYKTHYSWLTLLYNRCFMITKSWRLLPAIFIWYLRFRICYCLHAIKVACISLFSFLADFNTSIPAVKIGLFYDSYIKPHSFWEHITFDVLEFNPETYSRTKTPQSTIV